MVFPDPLEFVWDKGNTDKNWIKHHVSNTEAEEVFFDPKKKITKDDLHSGTEKRYIVIGKTKRNVVLFIACTVRNHKIRVISARKINKKEVKLYEKNA